MTHDSPMPAVTLMDAPSVRRALGGLSNTTLYEGIKRGIYCRGLRITERRVAWPAHEISAINAARIAGKSDDEIKALVKELEASRATAFDRVGA